MSSNLGGLNLRRLWELQMEMQCSNCYIVLTRERSGLVIYLGSPQRFRQGDR